MAEKASARALDFSNVKDRGPVNPIHQKPGDYKGKVMSVTDIEMGETKRPGWLFIIKINSGTYAYRCGFTEKELWKIRNLFVACGISVPKKRVNVNPKLVVGKFVGCSLDDHEYDDKLSSEIKATFPTSELEGDDGEPVDDEDGEGEDEDTDSEDEEEEASDDADEEDEPEEEAPAPKKKAAAKKAPEPEEDDEDDLESLDIEDL
jgi:hypothetical protein